MDLPRISKPLHIPAIFGTAYVAACILCLPLYMKNGYIGLIGGKFSLVVALTYIGIAGTLVFACLRKIPLETGVLRSGGLWLIPFCISYAIAAFFSTNSYTPIWGQYGRNNGLVLFLSCTVLFFVARLFFSKRFYPIIESCIAYCSGIVALFGWLNYWKIDPLGVYYSVKEQDAHMFLSTIGNINFFGSFLCLFTPVAIQKAMQTKHPVYIACAVLSLSAFVPANSDGAWIAVVICTLVLLCNRRFTQDSFQQLCGLGILCCAVWVVNSVRSIFFAVQGPLRTVSAFVGSLPISLAGIFVLGGLFFLCQKREFPVRKVGLAFSCIFVLALVAALFLRNVLKIPLGPLDGLFYLDQTWGSNRGYLWFLLCLVYGGFSLPQKLFGAGADMLYELLNPHYTSYIVALNGSTFDSAHNEFFQHLLCGGAIALVTWCGFLFGRIRACAKHCPAISLALLGYAVQSFFSISMPGVFPLVFVFAAIGSQRTLPSCCPSTQDKILVALSTFFISVAAILLSHIVL